MREEELFSGYDDDTLSAVRRFEKMLEQRQHYFFDVEDFESIIDFYINTHNEKLAFEALELACKIHPYSTEIRLRKAEVLILNKQYSEALAHLSIVKSLDPENSDLYYLQGEAYLHLKNQQLANVSFREAMKHSTEDTSGLAFNIGILYREVDDLSSAIPYFLLAYERESNSLGLLFELGYCYDVLGELDQSERFYNEYLDIDSFSSSVWYNLGIVYVKNGNYTQGLYAYDMALAVEPDNVSVMHNLGSTYIAIEKYVEAVELYTRLAELEPFNPWVLTSLGECYDRMGDNDKAIACFDKALVIEPSLSDAFYGKALVFIKSDRFFLAFENIKNAIAIEVDNYDYWLVCGKVNLEMGEHAQAVEAYQEAISIDTDELDAYVGLAEVYLDQKEYHKVQEIFEEVDQKFPEESILKVLYAVSLYLQDLKEHALELITLALQHRPNAKDEFLSILSETNDEGFLLRLNAL